MDFIAADILSPPSGFPADGGVRTARAAPSPSSNGIRKSFSAVLQGARGEERRGETREVDDVRSTDKSDREPRSKETKGLNPSATQTERAESSFSHAKDGDRSSDDENNRAEVSKTDSESAGQESNTGSDVQEHDPAPMPALMSFQTIPEAIGQTEVRPEEGGHTEEEGDSGGVAHSSESDAEASGGSSTSPLILLAMMDSPAPGSNSAEDRSVPNKITSPLLGLPEQESDAMAIQSHNDSQAAQVIKQSSYVVVDDNGSEAANLGENSPVPVEAQSGSALLNPDSAARRAFQAYLEARSSNGKSETSGPDSDQHEEVSKDHPVSTQGNWYAPSLSDGQDIGGMARSVLPQGQSSSFASFEGSARFSEFWDDQHSPQHDQTETKLPQAAVAEHQVSSGQSTESIMAGAHGPVVSGPPPPPLTAPFVSQSQPATSAHDPAEQSVRLMARSVVFDLAQPDLGYVNVRVAMMNDVVHTHLSADRLEVGQFLINGQDRLQAAFQANGLDMGQFRVDIDRQSAGRSFHHGPSQEQGQTWDQGSQGMTWGQNPDQQDEQRISLHGLLNVMA